MLVTCPMCQSIFKLADNNNPNLKMRCSICANVFSLGETAVLPDDVSFDGFDNMDSPLTTIDGPEVKKKTGLRIVLIVLFLSLAFLGGAWNFTNYLDPLKAMVNSKNVEEIEKENKAVDELFQRVRLLELANIRQFVVPNTENEKFDKLTIIEGKVVNNFDEPRSFVQLEATLFDVEGNALEEKTQMAGPKISFFQLQVLGEIELEQALRDNISILNYNTNIQPKESVPFMFIFYNPPETAANFNIRIIGAQVPEVEETEPKENDK